MDASWIERAAALHEAGQPFILATVVARGAPQAARVGDKAVITAAGELAGWIGAGCVRPTVIREALAVLEARTPRRLIFDSQLASAGTESAPAAQAGGAVSGATVVGRRSSVVGPAAAVERRFPMTCQGEGTVEIYLEPIMPKPQLLVMGATPVAEALVALALPLGWEPSVAHPKAHAAAYPAGVRIGGDFPAAVASAAPGAAIVVATMGDGDEEALEAALESDADYVGLVSSRKKAESLYAHLRSQGVESAALGRITCPAGLDLGARGPAEIALSILAQIVQRRGGRPAAGDARNGLPVVESAPAPRATRAAASGGGAPGDERRAGVVATDPVCGMGVEVEGARHTFEHDGRYFYFCCPHCKAAFEKDPASYAGTAG